MTTPVRSSRSSTRAGRGTNAGLLDPKKPILDVAPLNSFPYIAAPSSLNNPSSSPEEGKNNGGAHIAEPALIYLPPHATQEEFDNLVATTKCGVVLTGSAAVGTIGPVVGRTEILENESSYMFRVLLPGVSRDEKDFSCDVSPEGKISIKGITTTGETMIVKHSQVFKMLTQNFSPPGHFTVTFQLPGPVEDQLFDGSFADGILEGSVKKRLPVKVYTKKKKDQQQI